MTTVSRPPPEGADLLTHSRRQCFKKCPRKHFYAYELGIRSGTTAKPLRMGGAVHVALDVRGKGEARETAIARAITSYEELPDWASTDELVFEWAIERVKVIELIDGYFWRWEDAKQPGDIEIAEVIQSEKVFRLPILNPDTGKATPTFQRAGKRDKVVRLADGRIAVQEHKTCGQDIGPESDYWLRLEIDEQISEYFVTGRTEGFDIATVLYDVIRKPTIEPRLIPVIDENGFKIVLDAAGDRVFKKNGEPRESGDSEQGWKVQTRRETPKEYGARLRQDIRERPDFYYQRREIPRLDSDLAEHDHEMWQIQQSIREAQKSGRWYRNTNSCTNMGRCEYLRICRNGLRMGDEPPTGFRRVSNVHEELEEADE